MNEHPLISVVVPVYNVEKYLPRCIESILKQTYTNFELILVDDGTPDRSGIICDRYAEKDSRIRVIHKENGGVSTARNAGIDAAKGEWITFVDSDDWIDENYLHVLQSPLNENYYDMTVGELNWRYITISYKETDAYVLEAQKMAGSEELLGGVHFSGPCFKLFSLDIIKRQEIYFPVNVAKGEDSFFVAKYLQQCTKIYMTGKPIYFYNWLNTDSVTHKDPYYEERYLWDIYNIDEYEKVLTRFGITEPLKGDLVSKRAIVGFIDVVSPIMNKFDVDEAKSKISELLNYYDNWIKKDYRWIIDIKSEMVRRVAECFVKREADSIYYILASKQQERQSFSKKIKRQVKKMIIPFLEKYRDGLIKFKF